MTAGVRVKLCGLSGAADAVAAAFAGADYLGFVLAQGRRQVAAHDAALAMAAVRQAYEMERESAAQAVLVMVDPTLDEAQRALEVSGARHIQLAGDETPELCDLLRTRTGCTVWKAWGVRGTDDDRRIADYVGAVDALMFDTHRGGARGGTGIAFDWRALGPLRPLYGETPVVIAGGLTPENVADLLALHRPFAVDVSSGIEEDGRKDPEKMRLFVQRVRSFRMNEANHEQGSVTDVPG